MRVLILGAAAGGGLPQWNCGCRNCVDARDPASPVKPQTQSSIAVSKDGERWAIINASPDIRTQISAVARLHPTALRHSPVQSVVLTNGDIDHIAGLLVLREKQPFNVFATGEILGLFETNPVFEVLDRDLVARTTIGVGTAFEPVPGVVAELFSVPGKVPLFMEEGDAIKTDMEGEQTVGVELKAAGKRAYYIPGCARMTAALAERLEGADLLLFDGTVFNDSEMADTGAGIKTGRRMGHMPMSGPGGSMAEIAKIDIARKAYVHINNTNPVWQPASPERRAAEADGWTIGADGMEFEL